MVHFNNMNDMNNTITQLLKEHNDSTLNTIYIESSKFFTEHIEYIMDTLGNPSSINKAVQRELADELTDVCQEFFQLVTNDSSQLRNRDILYNVVYGVTDKTISVRKIPYSRRLDINKLSMNIRNEMMMILLLGLG